MARNPIDGHTAPKLRSDSAAELRKCGLVSTMLIRSAEIIFSAGINELCARDENNLK